jgi:hypothetical protein
MNHLDCTELLVDYLNHSLDLLGGDGPEEKDQGFILGMSYPTQP